MSTYAAILVLLAFIIFLKKYLFVFRQRGREGEKHQRVFASRAAPTGDLACKPGMCPDWELNWRPFGLQASTQPLARANYSYFLKDFRYLF